MAATATEHAMNSKRSHHGPLVDDIGTAFRVWAPERRRIDVVLVDPNGREQRKVPLSRGADGYFSEHLTDVGDGAFYFYQVDGDPRNYPDPASNFQPQGVHGPSQVIDHRRFAWSDHQWPGVQMRGQVIYEMHIGAFTAEGNWRAAIDKLPHLRDVGITLLQVMPVAAFPGDFGWGYDGVHWFAPTQLYGTPDEMRAFVDRAHALGLGVILDVVYNHFGPDGNYLGAFSDDYMNRERENEWGESINFDGENCGPVREFFITNARYWIEEFHFDGFRFDATQSIHDKSEEYIVGAIGRAARET